MRHIRIIIALAAVLSTQPIFADEDMSDSKACSAVAKACVDGGYAKDQDKKFWQDCMKPLLLSKTVQGVTVDATTIKECRTDKINKLKNEISEFEKVN